VAEAGSVAAAANSRWLASAMFDVLVVCGAGGIAVMGSRPPEPKHAPAVSEASAIQAKRLDSPWAFIVVLMVRSP
jgi:hypothetical protein